MSWSENALNVFLNSVSACKNHISTWWRWCWSENINKSGLEHKLDGNYMLPLAGEASSAILVFSFWLVQSFVMSSKWLSKSTNSAWSPDSSIWLAIAWVSSQCRSIILTEQKKNNESAGQRLSLFGAKFLEQMKKHASGLQHLACNLFLWCWTLTGATWRCTFLLCLYVWHKRRLELGNSNSACTIAAKNWSRLFITCRDRHSTAFTSMLLLHIICPDDDDLFWGM